ncbi:hypothetical protein JKF63_01773 [Porcisia hertigi]|uniref:Uncharacterized protein n=1 Tax=Porcisia hertigi TaxID=2761500 RepID=A0A836L0E3_9TRYP|nr:hypothetical protein JKF63_01773 [Porcisia hertigi]
MVVVVFDADALSAWKLRLRDVARTNDMHTEQVLSCLDSLETLGCIQDDQPILPISKCDSLEDFAAAPPSNSTRISTGTQLWTVRPINYSHYVLNKVRRGRQVKKITRRLGDLAADLHSVGHDLWRILQTLTARHSLTTSPECPDTHKVKTLDSAACVKTTVAPPSASDVSPALSMSSYRALRSLFGNLPAFNADSLRRWSKLKTLSELAKATNELPTSSDTRLDASVQTPVEFVTHVTQTEASCQKLPFLCRHCRQDSRAEYDVNKEKMQLMQTRDISVPIGGGKRFTPLANPNVPSMDHTHSTRTFLPERSGPRRPQRRHRLPGL